MCLVCVCMCIRVCQTFCEHEKRKKKNRPFDCDRSHAIFNHHFWLFDDSRKRIENDKEMCAHTHMHVPYKQRVIPSRSHSLARYLCCSSSSTNTGSSSSTFSTIILHSHKKWSHFPTTQFHIFSFTDFSICQIRSFFSVCIFMYFDASFRNAVAMSVSRITKMRWWRRRRQRWQRRWRWWWCWSTVCMMWSAQGGTFRDAAIDIQRIFLLKRKTRTNEKKKHTQCVSCVSLFYLLIFQRE